MRALPMDHQARCRSLNRLPQSPYFRILCTA